MMDDVTLLRRYTDERSEDAFAELVRRHLPLVYSAALRRLGGDAHRAEDVAQMVFCALARDARKLARHPALTGWLYTATRYAATDVVRADRRRRVREGEAHIMQEIDSDHESHADWSRLRPVLDDAMDELSSVDREAVLLRFFQGRPFAEIGSALGLSEDTARKRVDRALEKLGHLLGRRKIASTSAALATLLASETISAAPASLAASITGTALATGGATTVGVATFLVMTKVQVGIAAAVVAAGTMGIIAQHRTISALHETTAAASQQLAALTQKNAALAKNRAAQETELARLRSAAAASRPAPVTGANQRETNPVLAKLVDSPATGLPPLPNSSSLQNKKANLHHRYDPFLLDQRGLTAAQADRFVELMIHQANARQDLQDSVEKAGLRGDARGVERLRSQLYAPITRELHEMLGEDGYAAYLDYEGASYYRVAFVEPMLPMFSSTNVALSSSQVDQLGKIIATNNHSVRVKPTDIGTQSRVDWDRVVADAAGVLTAEQLNVLRSYAHRQNPP